MFVSRSGSTLNAIFGMNEQGKPEATSKSDPKGVTLSDAQKLAVKNSKFFEAGASMSLLDQPGKMGHVFDQHAKQLAGLLCHILDGQSEAANHAVHFQGRQQTLGAVLQAAIKPLSRESDQIGRQMDSIQDFQPWLLYTLNTPLQGLADGSLKQGYPELLTKIRTLSAFGTTVWQLMNPVENQAKPELYSQHKQANADACAALLREVGLSLQADDFEARFKEFSGKTRTPGFDNPLSRARSERMPMVATDEDGERAVNGIYEDAAKYGLGFGQVVQRTVGGADDAALRQALGDRNQNINAIARSGAPIADLSRPFTMSEEDMGAVPEAYAQLGMAQMLEQHSMTHGTGINRWQPFGTFALESNQQGLPSAGAQSGGTCDILLALNTLGGERIYGNPDLALPAGLGIAAFMNFGGYHTFAETFPIAEAAAANRPYVPTNLAGVNQPDLYERIHASAEKYCPEGSEQMGNYLNAHKETLVALQAQHPDLDLSTRVHDVEFHGSPEMIENWRLK